MKCSSLMSIVLISTGRSREVPRTSKALIERSLGSLFSYLGLWSGAETRGIGGSMSTSLLSVVLGSSIVNTVNLFTGDWGALIAGRAVTPYKRLGKISDILHLNNENNQLER